MVKAWNATGRYIAAAILICTTTGAGAEQRTELLGDPETSNSMGRVVRIEPTTRYVNVEGGETIRFDINGKIFGWNFSGPLPVTSFNLRQVMPAGLLDHDVVVYIRANPDYRGPG